MVALDPIRCVGVIQRTTAGRAARRRVDNDPAALERARLSLDDFMVGLALPGRFPTRRNGIGLIIGDDRRLGVRPLPPAQVQSILDGKQQPSSGGAVAGNLDQRRLVELAVNDGMRLAVLAVQVLGHVDGILATTLAKGATSLMCSERVSAACAVTGMTLEGHHDVVLVGIELSHKHDGLGRGFDHGGHGVGASATQ